MSSTAMNVFFDTSALVTYFYDEPGLDQVELVTVLPNYTDCFGGGVLDSNRPVRPPIRT